MGSICERCMAWKLQKIDVLTITSLWALQRYWILLQTTSDEKSLLSENDSAASCFDWTNSLGASDSINIEWYYSFLIKKSSLSHVTTLGVKTSNP